MSSVVLSPAAERDLEDIWQTIAVDNSSAATRVLQGIGARIGQLAEHPRLGAPTGHSPHGPAAGRAALPHSVRN